MRAMRRLLPFIFAALAVVGCEDAAPDEPADIAVDAAADEAQADYQFLFMTSVRSDTLQGEAQFGIVLNRRIDTNELVVQLDAGGGYGGGLFIVRRDTTLPATGVHDLTRPADGEDRPERFEIVYQAGLGTQLSSTGGRIEFETVTDTLIVGSFEATMQGTVARGGVDDPLNEARVRGRFRADRGPIGYMIGL